MEGKVANQDRERNASPVVRAFEITESGLVEFKAPQRRRGFDQELSERVAKGVRQGYVVLDETCGRYVARDPLPPIMKGVFIVNGVAQRRDVNGMVCDEADDLTRRQDVADLGVMLETRIGQLAASAATGHSSQAHNGYPLVGLADAELAHSLITDLNVFLSGMAKHRPELLKRVREHLKIVDDRKRLAGAPRWFHEMKSIFEAGGHLRHMAQIDQSLVLFLLGVARLRCAELPEDLCYPSDDKIEAAVSFLKKLRIKGSSKRDPAWRDKSCGRAGDVNAWTATREFVICLAPKLAEDIPISAHNTRKNRRSANRRKSRGRATTNRV